MENGGPLGPSTFFEREAPAESPEAERMRGKVERYYREREAKQARFQLRAVALNFAMNYVNKTPGGAHRVVEAAEVFLAFLESKDERQDTLG